MNPPLAWSEIALYLDIISVKYGNCSDRDLSLVAIAIAMPLSVPDKA
ncbi:hypothetical protein [Pseudanabaena sp. PCC 6802]|nr:hypothetical protein [Pseudanabaena sp. PCC 6802]